MKQPKYKKSKYAKSKKINVKIKETPYTKVKYKNNYTNICTHCGITYDSANPPRDGVSYCTTKHRVADYRKGKL